MWQLRIMCSIIAITDLVFGEVHRVSTGVAGRHSSND